MRRSYVKEMVSVAVVLILTPLSGCSDTGHKKCSWGVKCPSGAVCHEPTEQCVLQAQIDACLDKDDYDPCNYPGSSPNHVCRNGICIFPVCGDSIIDPGEDCDGTEFGGATCDSLGLGEGTLGCNDDCSFDTSGCELDAVCGNNVIEESEVCDGEDLGGETCYSQGFYAGTLGCLPDCSDFDTSSCHGFCGDGTINGPEICDGLSLGGETCDTLGYHEGGVLGCLNDCSGFDTSGCEGGYCGDGEINGPEVCDGEDLGGETCESQGFYGGTLACLADCTGFDTSGCDPCPEGWVFIPAGDFEMGCDEGEPCWEGRSNESPRHTVTLSAYCMQRTQVSVAQYRECKDSGGCSNGTPTEMSFNTWCNWTSSPGDREDHPINCINWSEAREYCEWAGGDLPTEAQWEKAGRGTDQRTYPWGEEQPTCDRCNWNYTGSGSPYGCNAVTEGPGTWPVGYLTTTDGDSPYGLKDMAGNVWEWVLDCYDANFYATCVDGCVDPANNISGCTGNRVLRGGSFYSYDSAVLRVVTRSLNNPSARGSSFGFRCAMDPAE